MRQEHDKPGPCHRGAALGCQQSGAKIPRPAAGMLTDMWTSNDFFCRLGYSCCKPARHDAPETAVPSRTPTGPIVASIDGSGPCGPPPASTVTKPGRERCVQPLPLCTSNALKICRKLPSLGQPLVQRWQQADTRRSNTQALPRSRCFSRVCVGSDSPRNRWFADSPPEEAGFELEVPLARKDGSRGGRGRRSIKVASKYLSLSRGTSGSNPSPSSAESPNYRFRAGLPTLGSDRQQSSAFSLVPRSRRATCGLLLVSP